MIQSINFLSPPHIFAQTQKWKEMDTSGGVGKCVVGDVATIQGFECLFQNILQILVPIAGLAFFAMFLVGGFKYITSAGDPKKAAAATHTLTMAFIGIIGVIISWLILLFIKNFTGVNVTEFAIPTPNP